MAVERGTGTITSGGVTTTFGSPTTSPFDQRVNSERIESIRNKRAELNRLKDFYRQQYQTEAQALNAQPMTDQQFNAKITELQSKYKQKFNQDKFNLESKVEARLGGIKQLKQFVDTGVMEPDAAMEAIERMKLGPEAERARFPREDAGEKLAKLQYINEMERIGQWSSNKADLERRKLEPGYIGAEGPDERFKDLYLERGRILRELGGSRTNLPYRRVEPSPRVNVSQFRGMAPLSLPERKPYYEIRNPETGKFEKVDPDDPRFPLIQRNEQITREMQAVYPQPGSIQQTAILSNRFNPRIETPLTSKGSIQDQTKALVQQRQQPQARRLDEATAREILQEAGGDRDRAREIARSRGYSL